MAPFIRTVSVKRKKGTNFVRAVRKDSSETNARYAAANTLKKYREANEKRKEWKERKEERNKKIKKIHSKIRKGIDKILPTKKTMETQMKSRRILKKAKRATLVLDLG